MGGLPIAGFLGAAVFGGIVASFVIGYIVLPLWRRYRGVPKSEHSISSFDFFGTGVMAAKCTGTALFVLLLVLGFLQSRDYWDYEGGFDTHRVPLEYPYQLEAGQHLDRAWLSSWDDEGFLPEGSPDVSSLHLRGTDVVGRTAVRSGKYGFFDDKGWFTFSCSSGQLSVYETLPEWKQALDSMGYDGIPELTPFRQFYHSRWKEIDSTHQ